MSVSDTIPQSPLRPFFEPSPDAPEPPSIRSLIAKLGLQRHPEGGYYVETDRDPLRVPNPFPQLDSAVEIPPPALEAGVAMDDDDSTRSASTTIYYCLTPGSPKGVFHRNKGRTVHTLHRGRGRYIIIHADEGREGQKRRVESFWVGQDIDNGERLQWVVEGGKYKASFLLPDTEHGTSSEGLLISEVKIMNLDGRFDQRFFRCYNLC